MASATLAAIVEHASLLPSDGTGASIAVGSPAWYAWLADATSFAFRSNAGSFTAHKERRSATHSYWRAYRRCSGRLHRVYLGKSEELSLDRLNAVAAGLAGDLSGPASPDLPHTVEHNSAEHGPSHKLDSQLDPRATPASSATPAPAAADGAQSLHLLATKLTLPMSRISLVPRPSLVSRLDTAITQGQKLILFAAPAGFGKTTMVAEWLAERQKARGKRQRDDHDALLPSTFSLLPSRVAWLALDDADNQLNRFLAYVIAALETVYPQIGAAAWPLLRVQAASPPAHAILTTLLNALAAHPDQLLLVLDDYHTITNQAIHEALAFLIDHMPAHMHVVLTTRAEPALPLARLRARGQLMEVRADDLRFTPAEALYLFDQVHGLPLPPHAVATLEAHTEGWVTGLQLAALSLQKQDAAQIPAFLADFTGSHTYVFDYLAAEVFQQQPEHVRSFMVQTAVLERLCGPLCAALTGYDDAPALLEQLDQANLFLVRLDNNRRWYRYHHLFRDFLLEHLDRTMDAAQRGQLYSRASAWFGQQGLACEAVDHALFAQSWDDALRCMTPLMASQCFYEYYLDWPRWLAALPDAALLAELDLCRRLAWILIFTGHVEQADRPLSLAEQAWRAAGQQEKVGELLGIRALAWGWKGDFPRAIQAAQQALALLPTDAFDRQGVPAYVLGTSDLQLGHVGSATDWLIAASVVTHSESAIAHSPSEFFLSLASTTQLARAHQLRGDLQRAAELYRDVITRMGSTAYLQVPSAQIYLGSLYYEWDDLAEAERTLRTSIAAAERIGRARYWPSAWGRLARVLLARGDAPQAHAMAEHSLVVARALDNLPDIAEAEVLQGWLWLAQGDREAALRWLSTHTLPPDRSQPYTYQTAYLMRARIGIAQALHSARAVDLGAMMRELGQLFQLAETDQRLTDQITILALLALGHEAMHDRKAALESLRAALRLAAPAGYIRTLVDEGAPVRALLQALRAHDAASPTPEWHYTARLLAAFPPDANASSTPPPAPALLSEREQSVLQLMAAGRSVEEMAASLIISAHTVRTHVKNIYQKLDVHNRVQALERARVLRLL